MVLQREKALNMVRRIMVQANFWLSLGGCDFSCTQQPQSSAFWGTSQHSIWVIDWHKTWFGELGPLLFLGCAYSHFYKHGKLGPRTNECIFNRYPKPQKFLWCWATPLWRNDCNIIQSANFLKKKGFSSMDGMKKDLRFYELD